jgi:lambda repressor-like predicted transcriptional regulator
MKESRTERRGRPLVGVYVDGEKIRKAIKARHLSHRAAAAEIGYARSSVTNALITGYMSIDMLTAFAEWLDVEIEELKE